MYPEALNVFRDAYTVEFLGLPEVHAEADLHRALLEKLKETSASSVRNIPCRIGDRDFALDLLFFHRGHNCLVVFELLCGEPHKSSTATSRRRRR
jgi:predicted nuclease of restriction endonuclease-like (RecB) superfamily